ncbi:MAG: peptidoglycan DD-metalloendopeptidase family protein [Muribaculaceae bacterium]|nr:peptidoglycan DD-metalloendopeptidase family protein [Muribaculaceae bacterium]
MTSRLRQILVSFILPAAMLLAAAPLHAQSIDEMSRILSSLEQPSASAGKSASDGILGVLNTIDDTPYEGVLNVIAPASTSSANASAGGILDFISSAYRGTSYYDSANDYRDRHNSGNSLFKGSFPKFDTSDFYRPVWGHITSNYGYRPSFGRMHKGVDLALNVGDTVAAALPGIVGKIGYEAKGYGNFIVIKHSDGVETRYAHLQEAIVIPGQRVYAGDPIALGGNTGNSTGPHLHFEVRHFGVAVNPLSVFDFNSRQLKKGYDLEYPSGQQLATGFNATKTNLRSKSTYVVLPGDDVKSIAARAGITTLRLCQLNFITEHTPLEPGRMLKLK